MYAARLPSLRGRPPGVTELLRSVLSPVRVVFHVHRADCSVRPAKALRPVDSVGATVRASNASPVAACPLVNGLDTTRVGSVRACVVLPLVVTAQVGNCRYGATEFSVLGKADALAFADALLILGLVGEGLIEVVVDPDNDMVSIITLHHGVLIHWQPRLSVASRRVAMGDCRLEVASLENMVALEENEILIMFVNVCYGHSYSHSSQQALDKNI